MMKLPTTNDRTKETNMSVSLVKISKPVNLKKNVGNTYTER